MPLNSTILESICSSCSDIWMKIAIDSRRKLIGCVENVTYQILGEVELHTAKQINVLASFAVYAGAGRKNNGNGAMTQSGN